jgi:hypothetical protein
MCFIAQDVTTIAQETWGTSVRRLAAEALLKDGTMSFLLTTEVTKSLPDSAKSQVMQAARQEHFKVLEYHRSTFDNRCFLWHILHKRGMLLHSTLFV